MSLTGPLRRVTRCLRVSEPCFHHRYRLVCSGLMVLPPVYGDRGIITEPSHHGPVPLAYRHFRRLLCATSWGTTILLWWFAEEARQACPPAEGVLYLVADSPLKGKRGVTHPVV